MEVDVRQGGDVQVFLGFGGLVQCLRSSAIDGKHFCILVTEFVFVVFEHCLFELLWSLAQPVLFNIRVVALVLGLPEEVEGAVVEVQSTRLAWSLSR